MINGESYSFNQQVLILKNHLKLANVGFGVPHPTFDLGEQILDRWIDKNWLATLLSIFTFSAYAQQKQIDAPRDAIFERRS